MTREELKFKYPNASESFLRANSGQPVLADRNRGAAVLERSAGDGPLAEAPAQAQDTGRFLVRVTSFRHRLIDEDNLAEKFHIDCCRYAGILPSDAPEKTRIEVRQIKIPKADPQTILIEITPPKS